MAILALLWAPFKKIVAGLVIMVKALRQNTCESDAPGKYRLNTTRIGQFFGLLGYAFVMLFLASICIRLMINPTSIPSEVLSDLIKMLVTVGGLSTLFLAFYAMKGSQERRGSNGNTSVSVTATTNKEERSDKDPPRAIDVT